MPPVSPARFSLTGRLGTIVTAVLVAFAGLTWCAAHLDQVPRWLGLDEPPISIVIEPVPLGTALALAFVVVFPLALWAVSRAGRPLARTLAALSDGIRSFRDRDFSVRLVTRRRDELGELIRLYNRVGEVLQEERSQLRQRELLLQTALDRSPIAILLVNPRERILYANHEARRLFLGGARLVGHGLGEILKGCPEPLRQALGEENDGMVTVEGGGERETYHVAHRSFLLNRQRHRLYMLRRMTAELSRQESEIWKRVIRVISHELNNSLAPISSLAHSGSLVARKPEQIHKLEPIYASIRERVDYLTRFLEGYARFARLPHPKKQLVDWRAWLEAPARLYTFEVAADPPACPGWFDPSQVQQVLINLLKNGVEASDERPEISVRIDPLPDGGARVQVSDRGRGMSEEVLRKALLPFYSTKPSGTGVGLALCREIVEAHGGSLRIQARSGGGTVVSFWLPPAPGGPGVV